MRQLIPPPFFEGSKNREGATGEGVAAAASSLFYSGDNMPFHFCPNELMMLMIALPIIGRFFHWVLHKLKGQRPCSESEKEESCSLAQCGHSDECSPIYDPLDPG